MTQKDANEFKTSEFILICTLVYGGVAVKGFESDPINPRRAVAVFRSSKKLEEIRQRLYSGRMSVDPVRFWVTVREVKGRIRDALEERRWS